MSTLGSRIVLKKTWGTNCRAVALELPDVVLYPTGGGTGPLVCKAFDEMERLGWISSQRLAWSPCKPVAPIVQAWVAGARLRRISPIPTQLLLLRCPRLGISDVRSRAGAEVVR
jgi:hypothetical protein